MPGAFHKIKGLEEVTWWGSCLGQTFQFQKHRVARDCSSCPFVEFCLYTLRFDVQKNLFLPLLRQMRFKLLQRKDKNEGGLIHTQYEPKNTRRGTRLVRVPKIFTPSPVKQPSTSTSQTPAQKSTPSPVQQPSPTRRPTPAQQSSPGRQNCMP